MAKEGRIERGNPKGSLFGFGFYELTFDFIPSASMKIASIVPVRNFSPTNRFLSKRANVMGIISVCNLYVTPFAYLSLRPSTTVYSQGV